MTTRILIMAGGTGGHVFPALAVADELRSRHVNIQWMGTQKGLEAQLIPAAGYPLNFISVQGLRGKGLLAWLLIPFKLIKAIIEAIRVIQKFKPDVVLGFGGFASGPGGVAARLIGKPLVIHEQNAIPGLTNRVLSNITAYVLAGFPQSFRSSVHALWIGNPVRASIKAITEPEQRMTGREGPINILVLGGSLGARSLNTLVPQAFSLIEVDYKIKHQCGVKHKDNCKKNYQDVNVNAEVVSFIDDMATAYEWADLVICRAGALTIAELSAVGIGSLLIPYPYAVDDHQTHNASALVTIGAAIIMQEDDMTIMSLTEAIQSLLADHNLLIEMAKNARSLAKPDTVNQIATLCLKVAHE